VIFLKILPHPFFYLLFLFKDPLSFLFSEFLSPPSISLIFPNKFGLLTFPFKPPCHFRIFLNIFFLCCREFARCQSQSSFCLFELVTARHSHRVFSITLFERFASPHSPRKVSTLNLPSSPCRNRKDLRVIGRPLLSILRSSVFIKPGPFASPSLQNHSHESRLCPLSF